MKKWKRREIKLKKPNAKKKPDWWKVFLDQGDISEYELLRLIKN